MDSNESRTESGTATPNPRGLKATVTIMGVLLVVGFFVVFVTIIYRVVSPGDDREAAAARGVFGEVDVALPVGARIVGTEYAGDKAIVRLRDAGGLETLIILDTKRGHEAGRFQLVPR